MSRYRTRLIASELNGADAPHPDASQSASLYPLRFELVYEYRAWGGRRLSDWMGAPLPGNEPIGEAWLLSDRASHSSVVADGSLRGQTLRQVIERWPVAMMGRQARGSSRFPLLLKFLDVTDRLSVQVHPSDLQPAFLPMGDSGKTEGWVVLEAGGARVGSLPASPRVPLGVRCVRPLRRARSRRRLHPSIRGWGMPS